MQRMLSLLRDDQPQPEAGQPVWCLGRRYENREDRWSEEFLADVAARIWLMYRTQFATPIQRHPDGPSPLAQNVAAFFRGQPSLQAASTMMDASAFTSDVGWGCMIRTGQSLLANALAIAEFGRDFRPGRELESESGSQQGGKSGGQQGVDSGGQQGGDSGSQPGSQVASHAASQPTSQPGSLLGSQSDSLSEVELLRKFSDDPAAPYSIHHFVEYGAEKCGKLPGQWFGPSAVAQCIAQFADIRVYRSVAMDVLEPEVLGGSFPVLVLCGLRLGIQNVNPVYYDGLRSLLTAPQAVGIAGGRTSASHYFYGFQNERLFFHDPHEPKAALTADAPAAEFVESMHSQRLRALPFSEMDPSMLAGFLITSADDYARWKEHMYSVPAKSRVVNIMADRPADAVAGLSDDDEGPEMEGFVMCETSAQNEDAVLVDSARRQTTEPAQDEDEDDAAAESTPAEQ